MTGEAVDGKLAAAASRAGVGIIRAHDLARFASATARYGIGQENVEKVLLSPGWSRLEIPGAVFVGSVRRYFPKPKCLSISLNGTIKVEVGHTLWVRLRDRYERFEVTSMQQDKVAIDAAKAGDVGVIVDLKRNEVAEGAEVFLDTSRSASDNCKVRTHSLLQELLGGFKSGY